jgi:Cu-processing system ATP-binding protein
MARRSEVTAAIHLEGVAKHYGALAAVRNITLQLGEGQTVALVGHNGAGKTTLFKLMLGLTRSSAGTIRVLGADPLSPDGQRARLEIGYLPENVVFSSTLTGLETLQFYATLKRRSRSECVALLERVGLAHAARKRVSTYSKGMRQRLGLAQAVIGAPRLLFLDEPTTGLDPLVRQSFYELVGELRGRGVTAILSSHALSELEIRCEPWPDCRSG